MTDNATSDPIYCPPNVESGTERDSLAKTPLYSQPSSGTHAEEKTRAVCKGTHIQTWEDEGGAHPVVSRDFHRNSGLTTKSRFRTHVSSAEAMMESGQYDQACDEIEAATKLFLQYKTEVYSLLDTSISHLSTLGCRASPLHPKALQLVRARQKIDA